MDRHHGHVGHHALPPRPTGAASSYERPTEQSQRVVRDYYQRFNGHYPRGYRDYDHVPSQRRTLDYTDSERDAYRRGPLRGRKRFTRYDPDDGYQDIIRGDDVRDGQIPPRLERPSLVISHQRATYGDKTRRSASPNRHDPRGTHGIEARRRARDEEGPKYASQETLESARAGKKKAQLEPLPLNRKRGVDLDDGSQATTGRPTPIKKNRNSKGDRSDRLCLECGNYHSTPCYVPRCTSCESRHYPRVKCVDALVQLKQRLTFHMDTPPRKAPSKTKLEAPLLSSGPNASIPSSKSTTAESDESPKRDGRDLFEKKGGLFCRECGSYHRLPCAWPSCRQCSKKHHPDTTCAVAEARLQRRLKDENERQARDITDATNKLAASTLHHQNSSNNSTTQKQGDSSPPSAIDTEGTFIKIKKGTRFCLDCGRYLCRPCLWPTCERCGSKHTTHVSCSDAYAAHQARLKEFDSRYRTNLAQMAAANYKNMNYALRSPPSRNRTEQAPSLRPIDKTMPVDLTTLTNSNTVSEARGPWPTNQIAEATHESDRGAFIHQSVEEFLEPYLNKANAQRSHHNSTEAPGSNAIVSYSFSGHGHPANAPFPSNEQRRLETVPEANEIAHAPPSYFDYFRRSNAPDRDVSRQDPPSYFDFRHQG